MGTCDASFCSKKREKEMSKFGRNETTIMYRFFLRYGAKYKVVGDKIERTCKTLYIAPIYINKLWHELMFPYVVERENE